MERVENTQVKGSLKNDPVDYVEILPNGEMRRVDIDGGGRHGEKIWKPREKKAKEKELDAGSKL